MEAILINFVKNEWPFYEDIPEERVFPIEYALQQGLEIGTDGLRVMGYPIKLLRAAEPRYVETFLSYDYATENKVSHDVAKAVCERHGIDFQKHLGVWHENQVGDLRESLVELDDTLRKLKQ